MDDDLYLSNDDYDVEIELESDDDIDCKKRNKKRETSKKGKNEKGGKESKTTKKKNNNDDDDNDDNDDDDDDDDDDDEEENLKDIEEEILETPIPSNNVNDIVNEMKQSPNIKINKLYTGITDPLKYKILQNSTDVDEYIVPPDKRKTSHILGKAERTELIGIRAQHIAMNSVKYVDIENETNAIEIAEKELKQKKIPLLLKRRLNKYTYEIWDPNEMTINWMD